MRTEEAQCAAPACHWPHGLGQDPVILILDGACPDEPAPLCHDIMLVMPRPVAQFMTMSDMSPGL